MLVRISIKRICIGLLFGLFTGSLINLTAPDVFGPALAILPKNTAEPAFVEDHPDIPQQQIQKLKKRVETLRTAYLQLAPENPYLIVNTSGNDFEIKTKNTILHKGTCSTGSYILLKVGNQREWFFQTPRGVFRVTVKLVDPVWYKPDWAYLEEGLPIPTRYTSARYEKGVLGDYGIAFGKGYLIHGTLYTRFLGMPVTHGCIRMGDEDILRAYQELLHGSRIYIY